jgi:phage shock protein A
MGIIDRVSTLLKSNINDLISKAENPEKMLNQLIADMRAQLAKAKQEVASTIADEKKLQAEAEKEKKQAEDWERRAMLAVQENRDDLAKQALVRFNEHLQGAQALHETWQRQRGETEALKNALRQLNDKIEEAKRRKTVLVARHRRAEAQQRIQETMSSMGDKSALESFDRMAEKIEERERKALAALIAELSQGELMSLQERYVGLFDRSRALSLLKARLLAAEQQKQQRERAETRKLQIGSGDRSERIRTYNFPQGRVTDHRIELTVYRLPEIMNGKLDELIDPLTQEYQAEELESGN